MAKIFKRKRNGNESEGNSDINTTSIHVPLCDEMKKAKSKKFEDHESLDSEKLSSIDALFPTFFYAASERLEEIFNFSKVGNESYEEIENNEGNNNKSFVKQKSYSSSNIITQNQCESFLGKLCLLKGTLQNMQNLSAQSLRKCAKEKQKKQELYLQLQQTMKAKDFAEIKLQKIKKKYKLLKEQISKKLNHPTSEKNFQVQIQLEPFENISKEAHHVEVGPKLYNNGYEIQPDAIESVSSNSSTVENHSVNDKLSGNSRFFNSDNTSTGNNFSEKSTNCGLVDAKNSIEDDIMECKLTDVISNTSDIIEKDNFVDASMEDPSDDDIKIISSSGVEMQSDVDIEIISNDETIENNCVGSEYSDVDKHVDQSSDSLEFTDSSKNEYSGSEIITNVHSLQPGEAKSISKANFSGKSRYNSSTRLRPLDSSELLNCTSDYVIVNEDFKVPEGMMGFIIGREGRNLRKLKRRCGCNIFIPYETEESTENTLSITGPPSQIQKAKEMLDEMCKKRILFNPRLLPPGHVWRQKVIKNSDINIVMGPRGETLKKLQEDAGVMMGFKTENFSEWEENIPLRIVGPIDKINYALMLLNKILSKSQDIYSNGQLIPSITKNDKKKIAALNRYEELKLNSKLAQRKKNFMINMKKPTVDISTAVVTAPTDYLSTNKISGNAGISKKTVQDEKKKKRPSNAKKHVCELPKPRKPEKAIDKYTKELSKYLQNNAQNVPVTTHNSICEHANDMFSEKQDVIIEEIILHKPKKPLATLMLSDNEDVD